MSSQKKCSKTAISSTKVLKKLFLTNVPIGSCSLLTQEHVVNISKKFTMWIARYKHPNSLKSFFRPCEKEGSNTSQAHFSIYKNCPKWWYFFELFFLDKLATCLKIFTSFGTVHTTYREELVSRKKLTTIQNTEFSYGIKKIPIPIVVMLQLTIYIL